MNKYFYCYSYKLMKFLKLQDERYIFKGKHPNGNAFWVFSSSEILNKKLDKWNVYKKTFREEEQDDRKTETVRRELPR